MGMVVRRRRSAHHAQFLFAGQIWSARRYDDDEGRDRLRAREVLSSPGIDRSGVVRPGRLGGSLHHSASGRHFDHRGKLRVLGHCPVRRF